MKILISAHAVEQFMKKTGAKSPEKARIKLEEMIGKATRVQLKKGYSIRQLFRHNFQPAIYLKYSNWFFVISETNHNLITCYPTVGDRWEDYIEFNIPNWAQELEK